jgi:hypothetical protein
LGRFLSNAAIVDEPGKMQPLSKDIGRLVSKILYVVSENKENLLYNAKRGHFISTGIVNSKLTFFTLRMRAMLEKDAVQNWT